MASIFSRIIAGEIPCYKVGEDERNFAFLDINPLQRGHVLVVPKREVDYLFDLPQEDYASLMAFASRVAKAVKKACPCVKVGMAVLGLEVPHAHIHLVPLQSEGDMDFRNKQTFTAEEMKQTAADIASHLQ